LPNLGQIHAMVAPLRRLLAASALTLYATLTLVGTARADLAPPPKDDPDDGGCLAGGLPWALPPIGLGIAFVVRHRARNRDQGSK